MRPANPYRHGSSAGASDKPSCQIGQDTSVNLGKQFHQTLRRSGTEGSYLAANACRGSQGAFRQRLDQPQRVTDMTAFMPVC